VSNDPVQCVDKNFDGRLFTISKLSCEFPQTLGTVLYESTRFRLGYPKFVARFVENAKNSLGFDLYIVTQECHKDGDEFLTHIVRVA
jgi:hypothetical protein